MSQVPPGFQQPTYPERGSPGYSEDGSGEGNGLLDWSFPGGTYDERAALQHWRETLNRWTAPDPGYKAGDVLPVQFKTDDKGNPLGGWSNWKYALPPQINAVGNALLDALEGFHTGQISPQSAATVAGLLGTGAFGGGLPVEGELHSFGGWKGASKLQKQKMISARDDLARGADPDEVFRRTQVYQDATGRLRFEIPDTGAKINLDKGADDYHRRTITDPETLAELKDPGARAASRDIARITGFDTTLGKIYSNPQLYEAYPHLRSIPVKILPLGDNSILPPGTAGRTQFPRSPGDKGKLILRPEGLDSRLGITNAIHEGQHLVQMNEGTPTGTNPKWLRQQYPHMSDEEIMQWYLKNYGEIEARNAEHRFRTQQYDIHPRRTEEYPGQAIIRAPDNSYHTPFDQHLPWLPHTPPNQLISPMRGAIYGPGNDIIGPVWHGSRHDIPGGEMRDDKIGTGEGSQIRGHGHYLGGAQGTGENYAEPSTRPTHSLDVVVPGTTVPPSSKMLADRAAVAYHENPDFYKNDPHEALFAHITNEINNDKLRIARHDATPPSEDTTSPAYKRLVETRRNVIVPANEKFRQDLLDGKLKFQVHPPGPGNLYEGHLLPDEHELLHHELPFANQPYVRDKILDAEEEGKLPRILPYNYDSMKGEDYYDRLATVLGGDPQASAALSKAGIPGLRYYDQFSRPPRMTRDEIKQRIQDHKDYIAHYERFGTQPVGSTQYYRDEAAIAKKEITRLQKILDTGDKITHNYVVFDPKNIKLTHKNGEPIKPISPEPLVPKPDEADSDIIDPIYHGSPHDIPGGEMRDDKIGTGEGSQVRGYGHYVGKAEGTGKSYVKPERKYPGYYLPYTGNEPALKNLAGATGLPNWHNPVHRQLHNIARIAEEDFAAGRYTDPHTAFETTLNDHERLTRNTMLGHDIAKIRHAWDSGDLKFNPIPRSQGYLYQGHIIPDEHELLHHDIPLSNQPYVHDKILEAEDNGKLPTILRSPIWNGRASTSGQDYYDTLGMKLLEGYTGRRSHNQADKLASAALSKAGIPGLRFYDQFSRTSDALPIKANMENMRQRLAETEKQRAMPGADPGLDKVINDFHYRLGVNQKQLDALPPVTHNYVIFDPKNIRLTHKNGQPIHRPETDPFKKKESK